MRPPGPAFDLSAALTSEIHAAQAALAHNTDPASIHCARVALKRARAIARLGRPGAPGLAAVFDESAQAAMRLLAPARENAALAALARKTAKKARAKPAASLESAAQRFDFAASVDAVEALSVQAALRDLHALAQVWPETSERHIQRGAAAIARRARRARKHGLGHDKTAARHIWRKREKERLFAASAAGVDWPRPRRIKAAARLAEALGQERDMHLLIERLSAPPIVANDAPTPKSVFKTLRRQAKRWARRADARGRKLAHLLA